jgi:hypothetical protein
MIGIGLDPHGPGISLNVGLVFVAGEEFAGPGQHHAAADHHQHP